MKKIFLILTLGAFLIYSCSNSEDVENGPLTDVNDGNNNPTGGGVWSIDKDLVFDGGPGKDGIPALVNPELIDASEANYLDDNDLVLGFKQGNQVVAYPHKILDWHEIINLDIGELSIALTYCPLTGTGVGWNRFINNNQTTFGVSGLLYKNNLIPYDRATDSNWSQLKLECVNGKLKGEKPEITIFPEMKWSLWKKIYPQTEVISKDTGFDRDYFEYPYGSYRTNNQYFIYAIEPLVKNIPAKERVHAIIVSNIAKVYQFDKFNNGKVIKDIIKSKDYLIVGNNDFIVSFFLDDSVNNLDFTYNFNDTEVILSDNEGNKWNLFGEAISGPRKGTFLEPARTSMMAYYFSIESFYSNVVVYE